MKKRTLAFLLALLTVLGTFPLSLFGVSANGTTDEEEQEKLVWDGKYAPLYVQDHLTFFWNGEGNKIGTASAVKALITNARNAEQSVTKSTYDREWAKYYTQKWEDLSTSTRSKMYAIDKGVVHVADGKLILTDFIPTRTLSSGTKALADMTLEVSQAYPEYYKTYANQTKGTLNTRGSETGAMFLGPVAVSYIKNVAASIRYGGTGKSDSYVPITYTDPETQQTRTVYVKSHVSSNQKLTAYDYDPVAGTMTPIADYTTPSGTVTGTTAGVFSNPTIGKYGIANSFSSYSPFDANGYGPLTEWGTGKVNNLATASTFVNFDNYGKESFMNAPADTPFTTTIIFNYDYDEDDLTTSVYNYTLSLGRDGVPLANSEYTASYNAETDYTTYTTGGTTYNSDNSNFAFTYGVSTSARYYYSLRIYSKVLSADEQAQNSFIDLAYQLDADMTDYINLNAKGKKIAHDLLAGKSAENVTLSDFNAAVKKAEEDQNKIVWDGNYAPLYVQKGLVYFWTGEGLKASSTTVSSIPNMLEGKTDAITHSTFDREEPGKKSEDTGLHTLAMNAVEGAVYFKEAVRARKLDLTPIIPYRAWDDSENAVQVLSDMTLEFSAYYGEATKAGYAGGGMALGPAGWTTYAKNNQNTYPNVSVFLDPDGNEIVGPLASSNVGNTAFLNTDKPLQSFTTSMIYNYDEDATDYKDIDFSLSFARDGASLTSKNGVFDATKDYYTYDDTNANYSAKKLYFTYGVSVLTYYQGIRIYDRVLTADEMAHNHFIDLSLRLGADMTAYLNASEELQKAVCKSFAGRYENTVTREQLENAVADIEEQLKEEEEKKEEEARLDALYADLYVTDVDGDNESDLLYRWDAFRFTKETRALTELKNKSGEGSVSVAGMTAYDRYATFTSIPDLTAFLPKETNGNHADLTLETVAHQTETKGAGTVALGSITPYAISLLSEKNANKGWIGSTYKALLSTSTTDVTYYFDASGQPTESLVTGGSGVTVTYLQENTTNQLATDSTWSETTWLAAPSGKTFTYGVSIDYDVAENGIGTFSVMTLRDGAVTRTNVVPYRRGYSPDAEANQTTKRIVPKNKAEADRMAKQEAYENMTWTNYTEQLAIGYTGYAYYAIRLYDKVLTEAQRNQNHFADLMAYFQIDRELIDLVIGAGQLDTAVTALAGVQFSGTTKEAVTKVLQGAYYANYLADYPVLTFEGYQVKKFESKGIRSLFTVDLSKATNKDATLVEIGAIMAIATNRVMTDLTLEKSNTAGSQMMSQAVWTQEGGFLAGKTFEDEGGLHFAYTLVYADDAQALAYGDVELLFRGYVVVEIDGVRYTSYADMTGEAFNDIHKVTLNRAYEKADTEKRVYAQSIQVGATESERRFVWTSERNTEAYVRYALKSAYLADGGFTEANTTVVKGTVTDMYGETTRKSCKVRVGGLALGEEYVYSVGGDYGFEEKVYTFKTQDNLDEHQSFNIISDIHNNQITGTSAAATQQKIDRLQNALAQMLAYTNDLSFVLSTGDNVSQYAMSLANPYDSYHIIGHNEHEQLFAAELLKTIPFASTMGNHEANVLASVSPEASVSGYYYDMPNESGDSGRYQDYSSGNFYFRNGNVLIIGVNVRATSSGSSANTSGAVAREFVKAACEANTDAKWRILVNHIPAYSYIGTREKADGTLGELGQMEQIICSICDDYDIDIMFSGHQHAFSRSYPIKGHNVLKDEVTTTVSTNGYSTTTATNPTGTVYYNVPAILSGTFYTVAADYEDYLVSWGLAYSSDLNEKVPGFDGITYTAPMYVNCQTDGDTLTVRLLQSSNNAVLDSYVLTKSAE